MMPGEFQQLEEAGAQWFRHFLSTVQIGELRSLFPAEADAAPGLRLSAGNIAKMSAVRCVTEVVRSCLGNDSRPVRAIAFDKNASANWALDWHQDRTIEVVEQIQTPGFCNWTRKQGRLHVSPPFGLLQRMLTVRIHLDAVDETNAPLLIAPGSHRLGVVAEDGIDAVVRRCGIEQCPADVGDIWLYSTLILHASARAEACGRRRVLQLDYSAEMLPAGLQWAADVVEAAA